MLLTHLLKALKFFYGMRVGGCERVFVFPCVGLLIDRNSLPWILSTL